MVNRVSVIAGDEYGEGATTLRVGSGGAGTVTLKDGVIPSAQESIASATPVVDTGFIATHGFDTQIAAAISPSIIEGDTQDATAEGAVHVQMRMEKAGLADSDAENVQIDIGHEPTAGDSAKMAADETKVHGIAPDAAMNPAVVTHIMRAAEEMGVKNPVILVNAFRAWLVVMLNMKVG